MLSKCNQTALRTGLLYVGTLMVWTANMQLASVVYRQRHGLLSRALLDHAAPPPLDVIDTASDAIQPQHNPGEQMLRIPCQ